MNGFDDSTQTNDPSAQKPVGFCQNCGKSLDAHTVRVVGPAVYCEPCLAARIAGAPPAAPNPNYGPGYAPVDQGAAAGWTAAPPIPGTPNPGLATLLGFIPGVGAMYNEQYAKGLVHLIVFVVLVALANVNGIFGILIAGWEFYMAIEAHHTARARRDGLPLPNPFGLNDIGERMGFGKAWQPAAAPAGAPVPPPAVAPGWGAPVDTAAQVPLNPGFGPGPYPYGAPAAAPYASPYAAPFSAAPEYGPVAGSTAWQQAGSVPPYGTPGVIPPFTPSANRFPAGAVWLIGLGAFFLLATTGVFDVFPARAFIGFGLIGLGIWTFLRRMTETGSGLTSDGTSAYPLRVFRALRVAAWLVLIGVWFLLDSFHVISFHRSWPLFVILAGVMTLLERLAYNSAANTAYLAPGPVPAAAGAYPASGAAATPSVPPTTTSAAEEHHTGGN